MLPGTSTRLRKAGCIIALLTGSVVSGCATTSDGVGAKNNNELTSSVPSLPVKGLALYSTYPSESMASACTMTSSTCVEDMISPDAFLAAMKESPDAASMLSSEQNQSDYELLIANLGHEHSPSLWQSVRNIVPGLSAPAVPSTQFAEFTVVWRGIELSSTVVEQTFTSEVSDQTMARELISQWWLETRSEELFSSQFLYSVLKASNYRDELHLPQRIDAFNQVTTELYPDPLEGAISRYVHPDYQEAMLDINVFPIRRPLSDTTSTILFDELHRDHIQAEAVAKQRSLTLSQEHPISSFSAGDNKQEGLRMSLMAESATTDTIYASIYVFRQKDKIIKITTTLPSRFSDALVSEAMHQIQVPEESLLMATLRKQSDPKSLVQ